MKIWNPPDRLSVLFLLAVLAALLWLTGCATVGASNCYAFLTVRGEGMVYINQFQLGTVDGVQRFCIKEPPQQYVMFFLTHKDEVYHSRVVDLYWERSLVWNPQQEKFFRMA